jgi:hypothetical protein
LAVYGSLIDHHTLHDALVIANHRVRGTEAIVTSDDGFAAEKPIREWSRPFPSDYGTTRRMSDSARVIAGRCATVFEGSREQKQHGDVIVLIRPDSTRYLLADRIQRLRVNT